MPQPPPNPSQAPARLARGRARKRAGLASVLPTMLFATALGGPAAAETYRWVDDTGATVYSQNRPAGGIRATVVETPKPGPAAGQASPPSKGRDRQAIEREFDQREEKKQQAEEAARKEAEVAAKKAAEQADRKRVCDTARRNLETLENHGGGRLRMPDGTARFLSRDELATMKAQSQDQIRGNCD